jgi:hypothetical protein
MTRTIEAALGIRLVAALDRKQLDRSTGGRRASDRVASTGRETQQKSVFVLSV